jgi:tetratricopeptide (TPR) repeat protein
LRLCYEEMTRRLGTSTTAAIVATRAPRPAAIVAPILAAISTLGLAALAASGCGARAASMSADEAASGLPSRDAPLELAYDQDLDEARDRYEALATGAPGREELRQSLAGEYARRIRAALDDAEHRYLAHEALMQLASLWTPAELASGAPGMDAHLEDARAVRDVFARAGGDLEAAAALYFLAAADPAARSAEANPYLAEVEEIYTFTNELAVASFGEGAERSRPIEILDAVVQWLPSRAVVDGLVERVRERQIALLGRFRDQGPNADLIRAHGAGLFRASWTIVRALARGGRLDEAPAALAGFESLGNDAQLAEKVGQALGPGAGGAHWLALAAQFQDEDPEQADPGAALRIALEGARRLPDDASLRYAAAALARDMERAVQSIALYEQGMAIAPERDAAEALAELYSIRVAALALAERPHAAQAALAALEKFHAQAQQRWPEKPLEADLATAYASMGRGMIGLGELALARSYLLQSQARRRNHDAVALLGTIALKQDRFAQALEHFEEALAMKADSVYERFERARVLRLAGDAQAGLGRREQAAQRWREAIEAWEALAERVELAPRFQGEMLVESARAHWALGDEDVAVRGFEAAVDVDADGEDTHTTVVSFLITRGDYQRALDTYHRALGNHDMSDYAKVYMSLWMLAEARRRGQQPDPLAYGFLRRREGTLWYDDLARYATGRVGLSALEGRASTRGRRAELWYYEAVLGEAGSERAVRELLERVLATEMVLFFEYDMAKYWLGEGKQRLSRTSP